MAEVKFIHPFEDDYHRARIETLNGIPIAEVSVTVDEEIYYNYMNALELFLKAKFAENMMEMMATLVEIGAPETLKKAIGDMCVMDMDAENAIAEAHEFQSMTELIEEHVFSDCH